MCDNDDERDEEKCIIGEEKFERNIKNGGKTKEVKDKSILLEIRS